MKRPTDNSVDYGQVSADLRRYLPLKVATGAWFICVLGLGTYGVCATWNQWWPYGAIPLHDAEAAKPAVYSFFGGLLGAGIYAFRGFYWAIGPQSATERRFQYDPNWTPWYVARPAMGAVLGVLTFAVVRSGVGLIATPSSSGTSSAAYFVFAFLAGFAVTEVLEWLNRSARKVFRGEEKPRSSGEGGNDGGDGNMAV